MQRIVDLHTHVLPAVDDGSRSVEESLAMLAALSRQGARGVAATPHFYAQRTTPEQFFERRQAAWECLAPHLGADAPELRLGAEVQYFEGIQRYDALERFRIEGTELLLLEMPVCVWTLRMLDAVLEINQRRDMRVMLAHIERYLRFQNAKTWELLLDNDVFMQASTEFFIRHSRKAMRMLREGRIHFLGTDSHNMESRCPNLEEALRVIERRGGGELLDELIRREAAVLGETEDDSAHSGRGGAAVSTGLS